MRFGVAEHNQVDLVERDFLVAPATEFPLDRRQCVALFGGDDATIGFLEFGRQAFFRSVEFRFDTIDLFLNLRFFVFQLGFGFLSVCFDLFRLGMRFFGFGIVVVDFFHSLKDLVGQDAIGHFRGGDLFFEVLIFDVARSAVELDLEFFYPSFAVLKTNLLGVRNDQSLFSFLLKLFGVFFGSDRGGFEYQQAFGSPLQASFQGGQLLVKVIKVP